MKVLRGEIKGIAFFHREGTSDLKTFEEVIGRGVYEKRGNKIQAGEHWADCGANVGAFSLLALSRGAQVDAFEPDPFSREIFQLNMKLNGYSMDRCRLHDVALIAGEQTSGVLHCGANGNFWRNSLCHDWGKGGVKVRCVKFDDAVNDEMCVKMDIEGSEMPIVEATARRFKKFIFEWSFDIDPDLERYWRCLDKLGESYDVKAQQYRDKGVTIWPKSWFPACTNVFCYAKA